jgi:diaminopimelate epimerase
MRFTKLQAVGNDFLVIAGQEAEAVSNPAELARRMCQRNFGAGADGLVLVTKSLSSEADFDSRIFNADGGEAEVSGNGTRCVAAFFFYTGMWPGPEIRIATGAGVKYGRLINRDSALFEFEFDMGRPQLRSDLIPITLDRPLDQVVKYHLPIGGEFLEVTSVSMGNPHCTLLVNEFETVNLTELGPLIEDHPFFPNRTNVEFVRVISRDEIEVLFWERGVGRTLSSGTGSCAAAVAAALNGVTGRQVRVRTEGGVLGVDWRENGVVYLTGPAEVVYQGDWLGAEC